MAVSSSLLLFMLAVIQRSSGETMTIERTTDYPDDDLKLPASLCPNTVPQCGKFNSLPLGGCWCHCGTKNASFYEPLWSCMQNNLVRRAGGCGNMLFTGDSTDRGLPVLSSTNSLSKEIIVPTNQNCSFFFTGGPEASYIACDGLWTNLSSTVITDRFDLTPGWSTTQLFVKVEPGIADNSFIDGRIIRLQMECRPQNAIQPVEKSCVLFAISGNFTCPYPQATVPPDRSTTNTKDQSPRLKETENQNPVASDIPTTPASSTSGTSEASDSASEGKSGSRKDDEKNTFIIAGAAAGGLLFLALVAIVIWRLRRPKKRASSHRRLVGTISRPASKNGRNSIPVYSDATNMYHTDTFLERQRSIDNPTYRKSSDGIIFLRDPESRKGSTYSDVFPTSAPPRPPPDKRGSVQGHVNPALSITEDVVTMNPLYEGNLVEHKGLDEKRSGMRSFGISPWGSGLDPRMHNEDKYQTYDVPEEVLARASRTSTPQYYVLEEPYPDSVTSPFSNGKVPNRGSPDGHVYDEPEGDLNRRPHVVMGNSHGRAPPRDEEPLSFRRLSTPEYNNGKAPDSPYRISQSEYEDTVPRRGIRLN